jgi:hypothetical protein
MTDDSEFDEEGWDESYAELINGLQEADLCKTLVHPCSREATASAAGDESNATIGEDFKFSAETVSTLNDRIQTMTDSPFQRFRGRRGVLSVLERQVLGLTVRLRI